MSWIIFALAAAVFAALVAIFGKIGIKNVDSTLATTVRAVVMAMFLTLTSLAPLEILMSKVLKLLNC